MTRLWLLGLLLLAVRARGDVVPQPAVGPAASELSVDDLPAMRERGTLRILVQGHGEDLLPRDGASSRADRDVVEAFAARTGLEPVIVDVERFEDLIPALLAGRGDVIAGRLTVTDARKKVIAFSRPLRVVDEVLVGRAQQVALRNVEDLGPRTIAVLAGSAHAQTLQALQARMTTTRIVTIDDARDEHDLAAAVARGEFDTTVIDSDVLAHVRAYNADVQPWLTLRKTRELALGVRPGNAKLKAALDAFLVERALTGHRDESELLDLPGIVARGSIRVLTRNDEPSYLLHKGEQTGFDYELIRMFARAHHLRVDVVVPPEPAELLTWLQAGRGDVVVAQLVAQHIAQDIEQDIKQDIKQHIGREGARAEVSTTAPYAWVDAVLVQRASEPRITSWSQLRGRTIMLAEHDGARDAAVALGAQHGFAVVPLQDDLDVDERIEAVAHGDVSLTLVPRPQLEAAVRGRTDVVASFVVVPAQPIVMAVRTGSTALKSALDAFIRDEVTRRSDGRIVGSTAYNLLQRAWLAHDDKAARRAPRRTSLPPGAISPYDALLQRRAAQYGLDWRLLAAQAFQESRFDPDARSFVGAQGLFQVMPSTGRELGFKNLHDPDEGVHAGVRYMAWLIDQFEPRIAFKHRVRFALAAYNAGKGHVDDARALAATMGLDRDKWFGHVEKAMLLLSNPRIARRTRYGYCRGSEPVKYVSEIQSRYDNYAMATPASAADLRR